MVEKREPEAVETYYVVQFSDHENLGVDACGLFVDENVSFLCGSPDRVARCRCGGTGLLEVKCPLKCVDKKPIDAGLSYLKVTATGVALRKSHKYYT